MQLLRIFLIPLLLYSIQAYASDLSTTGYCPFGACKGDDVNLLYSDPLTARILLSPKYSNAGGFIPKYNNDWKILSSNLNFGPENSQFSVRYSKSTGVCSSHLLLMLDDKKSHIEYFKRLLDRITSDTGHKGKKLSSSGIVSSGNQEIDEIFWSDNGLGKLKDVSMILLYGNRSIDTIDVIVAYNNYENCRKEDNRIPKLPDFSIK